MKRGNYLFVKPDGNDYILLMTPELQDDLGTLGYVDFVAGESVNVDDPIANVEASKTVLEIVSPLAGKVVEVNTSAESEPTLLNSANESENWLIRLTDVSDEAYQALPDV